MVALEASVCGTPVVAGDTGGLSEIVEDGETGVKVRPTTRTHWLRLS
ncbi:MAG TPA: glycosyltransferase [Armatimonadota bacterium]|nr:glycosyltransferase [Armatimonadota bacterium]